MDARGNSGAPVFSTPGLRCARARPAQKTYRPTLRREAGDLPVVHERGPQHRYRRAATVCRPNQQQRLADKVADRHIQRRGQRLQNRQLIEAVSVVLDLAQSVRLNPTQDYV